MFRNTKCAVVITDLKEKHMEHAKLMRPDGSTKNVYPKNQNFTLKELDKLVEGTIEIYPVEFNNNIVVCDEDALSKNLDPNHEFFIMSGIVLYGPVLLVPKHLFKIIKSPVGFSLK